MIKDFSINEQLEYWLILKRVQERYINREFICRKKMSEKRSRNRDLHDMATRREDDYIVMQNIINNINKLSKTDE
jgi:hypothetical protein